MHTLMHTVVHSTWIKYHSFAWFESVVEKLNNQLCLHLQANMHLPNKGLMFVNCHDDDLPTRVKAVETRDCDSMELRELW